MSTLRLTAQRPANASIRIASAQYLGHGISWTIGSGSSANKWVSIGVAEWVVDVAPTVIICIITGTIFVNYPVAVIIDSVAANLRLRITNSLASAGIVNGHTCTIRLAGVLIGLAITTTDGRP